MKISAAFPPVPATPEHIGLAEKLGYSTAWVYDTPALQLDCWMTLALAAARTRRIRLGPGVIIPSLRHPMVTASAIATLVSLVGESRVIIGVGTGFTGRRAMGQKPLRWQDMPRMVGDIRRLLAGETVEIEGAATRMLHWSGQAPNRPIEVPFVLGVNGPGACSRCQRLWRVAKSWRCSHRARTARPLPPRHSKCTFRSSNAGFYGCLNCASTIRRNGCQASTRAVSKIRWRRSDQHHANRARRDPVR